MRPVNIHPAPSDRTSCEICRKPIAKGELRMEEVTDFSAVDTQASTKSLWYHLPHAAESKPRELLSALKAFGHKVADRDSLMATSTAIIKELDKFMGNPHWKSNDRGSRVLSGKDWRLTVFEKSGFNWAMDGDPVVILNAITNEKSTLDETHSAAKSGSQFGPGFFVSANDATDNLWLFLRSKKIDAK